MIKRLFNLALVFSTLVPVLSSLGNVACSTDPGTPSSPQTTDDDIGNTDGDADTDGDGDADGDADADADGDADTDADTDSDADADGDADGDSDTDMDTDTDADGDADMDSDGDIETDSDDATDTDFDTDGSDTGPSDTGLPPCENGILDDNEEGIDCGGDCTECPVSYHLPPPDPCYNKFHAEGCTWDDPGSTCGGQCSVANSCSPPESSDKADLPITFICPRFMMFSQAMIQAANDDAVLYGWGDGREAPFNYAVVGHDADPGGLDDGSSSCCQCYQLIFETPEPSSPPPPDLPYPKSVIAQSFNTAASGPQGFDVFMGAGGYGAFNACYDDPAFANTSTFGVFIYDEYPFQNPGGGGISFLRYPECVGTDWPPTMTALRSSACQETLEQMCNQALVTASSEVTEDTRTSCLRTNQPESLYHQNWKVRAKRVQCPENLTRVTGCRLIEDHLPLPLPEVQTPADAEADGTFTRPDQNYHTTTMQDCCKPTCAWTDWVMPYNLPADGDWNSFYSCDKNGVPFTME